MSYTTQITGEEAVTLDEARNHLRITHFNEDNLIFSLIVAARQWAETYSEKAIVEQTVTAYYEQLASVMRLPLGNSSSLTKVDYLDPTGGAQSLTTGVILTKGTPSKLVFVDTPPDSKKQVDSVEVVYQAGYADGYVPERIKQAILLLVADMYEHREMQIVGQRFDQNATIDRLLFPTRELGI
jgi:uncharacterized phiE125 gp8 family phage protein